MIIIAHRISALSSCDEIIVLDEGKIVERGSHDELMSSDNGLYASIAYQQKNISESETGEE